MSISNIVIITGMHRSGTTFVGDILGHNKNNIVLHLFLYIKLHLHSNFLMFSCLLYTAYNVIF